MESASKRLYRSRRNRIFGGVCGGIAEYFEIDVAIVRIGWVIFTLIAGVGLLGYIIAWLFLPEENE